MSGSAVPLFWPSQLSAATAAAVARSAATRRLFGLLLSRRHHCSSKRAASAWRAWERVARTGDAEIDSVIAIWASSRSCQYFRTSTSRWQRGSRCTARITSRCSSAISTGADASLAGGSRYDWCDRATFRRRRTERQLLITEMRKYAGGLSTRSQQRRYSPQSPPERRPRRHRARRRAWPAVAGSAAATAPTPHRIPSRHRLRHVRIRTRRSHAVDQATT